MATVWRVGAGMVKNQFKRSKPGKRRSGIQPTSQPQGRGQYPQTNHSSPSAWKERVVTNAVARVRQPNQRRLYVCARASASTKYRPQSGSNACRICRIGVGAVGSRPRHVQLVGAVGYPRRSVPAIVTVGGAAPLSSVTSPGRSGERGGVRVGRLTRVR